MAMPCSACGSENKRKFASEIAIHLKQATDELTPPVLAFPQLAICMDCGFMEGRIDKNDLPYLACEQSPE